MLCKVDQNLCSACAVNYIYIFTIGHITFIKPVTKSAIILHKSAQGWTREEKNRCLEETEKSFKHSGEILRLILS